MARREAPCGGGMFSIVIDGDNVEAFEGGSEDGAMVVVNCGAAGVEGNMV